MKHGVYFEPSDCDLDAFRDIVSQSLTAADVPLATEVIKNVPVYDVPALLQGLRGEARKEIMAEWVRVLGQGAGVLVLRGAISDTSVLDDATRVYEQIIEDERGQGDRADHFATAGANDRIWNSLQKLCLNDPKVFARYFSHVAIDAVSEAWLGAGYQMTAQVNLVRPGGKAQTAHRDYHLGFQTEEVALNFPAHMHDLSAVLTLQGAVAHCDMPIESGPTKLLPFSQLYRPGYIAYRHADFSAFFEDHCIQLPLAKGDAVFFNPALFHAAGENYSPDIHRMANLLQVSSPFGRAMETIDRDAMSSALYPALKSLLDAGQIDAVDASAAIAACAEGYSFPTNLDTDPPVGGLAPETQAALFRRALDQGMSPDEFNTALGMLAARRQA